MPNFPILQTFARRWWVLLIRGVLAVLFGIMAFAMPGLTVLTLVLLFGAYALVDGLTAIWAAVTSRAWGLILFGILGILVAFYTFIFPGVTAIALLYLIAAWVLVRGIFEIVTAIQLRKEITNEWVLILSGFLSIIVGLLLFARPGAGVLAMAWVIGAYVLVSGLLLIILAFRVRGLHERLDKFAGAS
jgi:uncharacterized membrane protein HdeD (DUF308 family)